MCGIAGYFGRSRIDDVRVREALAKMAHRGPDHAGTFRTDSNGHHVLLLHTRLSIIDLDPRSNQPFGSDNLKLAFNGEIYNYLEVRRLLARESAFTTNSDTEVLLRGFQKWGNAAFEKMEGMWAAAIWSAERGELILSRDRFGEKPLYYHATSEGLYFASEVKALEALTGKPFEKNREQLLRYLVNGYKSLYKTAATWHKDILEVPSGSTLTIGRDLKPHLMRYWNPAPQIVEMSIDEAIAGVRERLIESMKLRLRADVPLAFCLSGGVDSAALASIAAKEFGYDVMSFSILDEDPRYDELDNIRATIDDIGCRHEIIKPPKADFLSRMKALVAAHDGPIATISYYVHSFLSEAISRNGFRVAVSGTAADELLTGYYDHHNLFLHEIRLHSEYSARLTEWRAHIAPVVRNPFLSDPEIYDKKPAFRGHVYLNRDEFLAMLRVPFNEDFFETRFCDSPLRNRMLNELFHEATPVILKEDDLNSMKYSIENRSPYLDTALFEFAFSIPTRHLIREGYGKYVLRAALKGILNDQVRLDRQKKGFNASLRSLLNFDDSDVRMELLNPASPVFELLDQAKVAALFDMNPLPNSYSKFLFNFINVKMFLEGAC